MKEIIPTAPQLPIIQKSCPNLLNIWPEQPRRHFLTLPLRAGQLNFALAFYKKGCEWCQS